MILTLALFIVTSASYRKEKQADVYAAVNQANYQMLNKIDDYIDDIADITKIPLTYKQADDVYMNHLRLFNDTRKSTYAFQQLNEQIFEEIFTYKKSVNSCFIYNLGGDGDYKVKYAIYQPFDPSDTPWFQDSINAFGKPVLVDTYELSGIVNDRLRPVYVFGIARGIVHLKSASVIGVLLVNTEVTYFEEICADMLLTGHHRVIILHGDQTIYDTETSRIGQPAESELLTIPDDTRKEMFSLTMDEQPMLASSVLSDTSDWRVISLIPEEELYSEINQIQQRNILIMLLVMAFSLFLLFFTTRRIVNPINRLSKIMKIAESGDFNTHIQVDSHDEVGVLSASYNSLLDKINELIQQVYAEKITSSELELQMLQSQINPHFLYNTLESISMMATMNDDETTAEMAALLGSILRYSISDFNQPVTLSDELNQVRKYIQLQEIRFHSQYHISLDVDVRFYPIQTPKMILQPIVENAIYHGMSSVRSGGIITIAASQPDRTTLHLLIHDNGTGMEEQQVKNLNGYIQEENNLFKSIGLRNVNRRIKLFCGSDYGVSVESSPMDGTTVTVCIRIDQTGSS